MYILSNNLINIIIKSKKIKIYIAYKLLMFCKKILLKIKTYLWAKIMII